MKKSIALLTLVLSLGAFAQEQAPIELNAEKITVHAASATVLRTNKTPGTVEITFLVPMASSICVRTEYRPVVVRSSLHCGNDVRIRRIAAGRVCTRKNPYNDECLRWEETFREERVLVPRTCTIQDSYCAQYGTDTQMERDSMKIQFKGLPALGDSEADSFIVTAQQKRCDNGDIVYDVKPLETVREYKVSQKKFLFWKRDAYVVEEK